MIAPDDQDQSRQPSGPSDPPPGNGEHGQIVPTTGARPAHRPGRTRWLLDIPLMLARYKTLTVRTVLVFTLVGVTYVLLLLEELTSQARVVRKAQGEGGGLPGGISGGLAGGALSGLGISLGERPVGSRRRPFRTFCRAGRCSWQWYGTRSVSRAPSVR